MKKGLAQRYRKAERTLLFEHLYEFIIRLWPLKVDTADKYDCDYESYSGVIPALKEVDEEHEIIIGELNIYNLLLHLDYAISIAVHRAGLIQRVVRPREIDQSYIRYLFEDKSIAYAVESDIRKVPKGLRKSLAYIYDKELIERYFLANGERSRPRSSVIDS